jgi:hypothetical protein
MGALSIEKLANLGLFGCWHTLAGYLGLLPPLFIWIWHLCEVNDKLGTHARSYLPLVFGCGWFFLSAVDLAIVYLTAIKYANEGWKGKGITQSTTGGVAKALKYGRSGIADKKFLVANIVASILYIIITSVQFGIPAPVGSGGLNVVIPSIGDGADNVTWDEMRAYSALKTVDNQGLFLSAIVIILFFVLSDQLAYVVGRLLLLNVQVRPETNPKSLTNQQPFSAPVGVSSPINLLSGGGGSKRV